MRRGILIVGIVLAALGAIIFAFAFVGFGADSSQTVPDYQSGSVETITPPPGLGTYTFSASWSGAPAGTTVYVVPCSTSACSNVAPSGAVARGSGSSGSLSASMTPGATYAIFAGQSSGPAVPVTVTYHFTGFTDLMLIGVVLLAIGILLAAAGARMAPRVAPVGTTTRVEEIAPEAPSAPYARPAPITPSSSTSAPTTRAAAEPTEPVGVRPEPPTPPRFMPASPEAASTPPPTSGAGARPNRTCAYCGTVNEPWITNCRKCKRPLSSTGTS